MPLQKLDVAGPGYDLTLGGNILAGNVGIGDAVTTGTISMGSALTSGVLNLGTSASMSGAISIGNATNTGNITIRTSADTDVYNMSFPDKFTVTQTTSKTTSVTSNSRVGTINTVTLTEAAGAQVIFTVLCDKCFNNDYIVGNTTLNPDTNEPVVVNFVNITSGSFQVLYYVPKGITSSSIGIQYFIV